MAVFGYKKLKHVMYCYAMNSSYECNNCICRWIEYNMTTVTFQISMMCDWGYQGRIQDLKLGVAQMDWKIWNTGGGGGGGGISYISNSITFL